MAKPSDDDTLALPDQGPQAGAARLKRGQIVDRYVILERVGAGGVGEVYSAYDPELERKIALKLVGVRIPDGRGQDRLLREAQAMARVSHPNVIAVHDVGVVDGRVFVAMELVDGHDLRGWLARHHDTDPWRRGRGWQAIVELFTAAGRGLAAAHEAKLIHRDFKPSNVLVGHDGRVRVMDFGLARSLLDPLDEAGLDGEDEEPRATSSLLDTTLTRAGAAVGTPPYMAPEQHRRGVHDERSDTYAFAAALYEALYGRRPFVADSEEGLLELKQASAPSAPAEAPPVPRWLRRIVQRGLQPEPGDRYPSMRALLDDLSRDPNARRRRLAQAFAAAALVGLGAFGYARAQRHGTNLCGDGDQRIAGVWDEDRKQSVRASLTATDVPYAETAWVETERALDGLSTDWLAMYEQACEATHVRGEQSQQLLDLRMHCLDRRLSDLDALASLLTTADASLVERAVVAAQSLRSVEHCADAVALTGMTPISEDARAELERLENDLAALGALTSASRLDEAEPLATSIAAEAGRLGHRPTQAEAFYALGFVQEKRGKLEAAEQSLFQAVEAAEAGRHDRMKARAWNWLVYVVGYRLARHNEGRRLAALASASIEGLGGDDELQAYLETGLGLVAQGEGRYDRALEHHTRALQLRERLHGTDHLTTASSRNNLGNAYTRLGRYPEALEQHQQALAIRKTILGSEHPEVGASLSHVGTCLTGLGRRDEAVVNHRRALELRERALGPNHAEVGTANTNLAVALYNIGRVEDALSHFQRALTIAEGVYGRDHPKVALALMNTGELLTVAGRYAEAHDHCDRGMTIARETLGPDHPNLAALGQGVAELLFAEGRFDEALAQFEAAASVAARALPAEHPVGAGAISGVGRCLLELGRTEQAIASLERALTIRENAPGVLPEQVGETRFALARALRRGGRDPARAQTLAEQARAALAGARSHTETTVADVDAWLAHTQ